MRHCHVNGLQRKTKKQTVSRRKSPIIPYPTIEKANEIIKHPQFCGQHTLFIHASVNNVEYNSAEDINEKLSALLLYCKAAYPEKIIYQASHQGKMTSMELLQKLMSC